MQLMRARDYERIWEFVLFLSGTAAQDMKTISEDECNLDAEKLYTLLIVEREEAREAKENQVGSSLVVRALAMAELAIQIGLLAGDSTASISAKHKRYIRKAIYLKDKYGPTTKESAQ